MKLAHRSFNITDLRIGNHRTLIEIHNVKKYLMRRGSKASDVHVTLYRYNKSIVEYCANNRNSTRGFSGDCYADYLPLEFDGETIEQSCILAQNALNVLIGNYNFPDDAIALFYSGNRSIHILIPVLCFGVFDPRPDFDRILFEIMLRIFLDEKLVEKVGEFNAWKSSHFDLEMYKPQMMLRFVNTLHEKTMRYKIPISMEMLDDPTRIIEASQSRRPYTPPTPVETPESLALGDDIRSLIAAGGELRGRGRTGSMTFMPRHSVDRLEGTTPGIGGYIARHRAYVEMLQGGMKDGENRAGRKGRRQALLSLVGYLKARKMSVEEAQAILTLWNDSNDPPLDEFIFNKTIESSYGGQ